MGGEPLTLALGLAAAAVLSLTLTVLTAVRRRRRELALLKALGMTRRQIGAIITWQTTLTLAIAIGAGAPLGVAAGRWAWGTFPGSLGVNPVTVVPVLLLAAGAAALILAGNRAAPPAAVVPRTAPAPALRAEWPPDEAVPCAASSNGLASLLRPRRNGAQAWPPRQLGPANAA